jgi:hypothetical protein
MGHASVTTTEIYADYSPDPTRGAALAEAAFGASSTNSSTKLSATEHNSEQLNPL